MNASPLARRLLATLAIASPLWLTAPAHATNVGVSVSVNQPGVYGRIDIGQQQPPVIYQQPVVIQQPVYGAVQRPIYLRVPPGHHKHWAKYCSRWRACNQPVYFVPEGWGAKARAYDKGYRDGRRDERRDDWREERREERRDHRHDHHDDHGHGHGRGRH